jgi:glyoxylase-like metal-dependent hydrolase (beta-lactamase superfamily II)
MFVVTPQGVIATDPISYLRPAKPYIDAIKAVTDKPIKYVIYSHHHYDHIAGGKPFKDAGAIFVAHRNAHRRLAALQSPDVVMPDMIVEDGGSTILLGGTRIDLLWLGNNHSDNTLVMLLPRERIIFTVDRLPIQAVMFRDVSDGYIPEWFAGLDRVLAMDWDRMIPGHPGPGGRLGTKDDVQQQLALMQEVSAAVKAEAQAGGCWDKVEKEMKFPKYEKWPGYEAGLPMVLRRYCGLWGRGT